MQLIYKRPRLHNYITKETKIVIKPKFFYPKSKFVVKFLLIFFFLFSQTCFKEQKQFRFEITIIIFFFRITSTQLQVISRPTIFSNLL